MEKRAQLLIVSLLVLATAAALAAHAQAPDPKALIAQADKLFEQKNYKDACREYEKALGLIAEARKLDEKDESISEYEVEFTESIAEKAVSECKSRRYSEAMEYMKAAQKYNNSPEKVKELPEKMFEAIVEKGEREFGWKQYDKAIESYEAALKLKDDPAVRERIEEAKKERDR